MEKYLIWSLSLRHIQTEIDPSQALHAVWSGPPLFAGTVEPRYLELAYFELLLISKWKSGPCFNMKLWQQVTT